MQWLIDLIKEWVQAQGYLTAGFIDRGDPRNDDWVLVDFTLDDIWHALDLSSIVPEGAKGVVFTLMFMNNTVGRSFALSRYNSVHNFNRSRLRCQVSNVIVSGDLTCPCDESRFVEYRGSAGGWTLLFLSVKGWWF